MPAPKYEQWCSQKCADKHGVPRKGTQWVHIWGTTRWVCASCATRLARAAGLRET